MNLIFSLNKNDIFFLTRNKNDISWLIYTILINIYNKNLINFLHGPTNFFLFFLKNGPSYIWCY